MTYEEALNVDSRSRRYMRSRIILEGKGLKPEKPRCVLCNHQAVIYSDTRLCEACDSTQKIKDIEKTPYKEFGDT